MRAELVVAGVLCGAAVAHAGPHPEAKRLFDEGRALLEQGQAAEACARFARSHELEHAPGTMLNLGECAERAGELGRAWALYDEAAREYERTSRPSSARFARSRADALVPKLAVVIVRLAEPGVAGLAVRIAGGAAAPAAQIIARREPGPISIEASAPGREPYTTTVTGAAGQAVEVRVPALRAAAPAGPVEASPPSRRGWQIAFWSSAVASLAGGGLWYYGWSEVRAAERLVCTGRYADACDPTAVPDEVRIQGNQQGQRGQRLSAVGIGVVVVGAGAAALTFYKGYLARGRQGEGARPRGRVAPVVTPSGLGLAIAGEF